MSSWNPISYTIYAARDDEADKGFVWICNPALPSRAIVKLRCDNDGRRWTTFCEARHIDRNFLKQYAEGRRGPRRPTTLPESRVRSPSGRKSTPLAMVLLVFAWAETLHSAMRLLASMRAHEQQPRP